MRSSGAKGSATNSIDGPVENGISHKDEDEARVIAEKVVQNVVKRAEREAEQRSPHRSPKVPRLPTFQIDTVPSPPWSPVELSPVGDEQEPIDEEQIDLHIEDQPSPECSLPDDLRESLRSYVEDILSQAMGVVEKKLKFVGIDDDDESEEESHDHQEEVAPPPPPPQEDEDEEEEDENEKRRRQEEEEEIRAAAQKVVEEVIAQAQERIEKEKEEEELQYPMSFEQAPEDVKEVASNLVKEIVGKAIAIAEEKSVPTVPFNFEDVDLMRTSGPWYVRVREALLRVLRSACFCTPRRNDS